MSKMNLEADNYPTIPTNGRSVLVDSNRSRLDMTSDTVNVQPSADNPRVRQQDTLSSGKRVQISLNQSASNETSVPPELQKRQQAIVVGKFFSICLVGSIENGYFDSVNDVYIKYSIVAGPDWIISSGSDVGITQIARYRLDENDARKFVWNQPIAISYRSYNYHGWPQIVISVYNFDTFGNDQILGYGCAFLPISSNLPSNHKQTVKIYSPQSSSYVRQILSWITGRKPELVDSNLFARGDCRSVLQMVTVGKAELSFSLTSKDSSNNGFRSG